MATPQPSYTALNKNDSNACESADPPLIKLKTLLDSLQFSYSNNLHNISCVLYNIVLAERLKQTNTP